MAALQRSPSRQQEAQALIAAQATSSFSPQALPPSPSATPLTTPLLSPTPLPSLTPSLFSQTLRPPSRTPPLQSPPPLPSEAQALIAAQATSSFSPQALPPSPSATPT